MELRFSKGFAFSDRIKSYGFSSQSFQKDILFCGVAQLKVVEKKIKKTIKYCHKLKRL